MNIFYDFNGETHRIMASEIEAIERSGPPHRAHDYADGHHGRGYFDITAESLSLTSRLMRERPGAVEAGLRPIDPINISGGQIKSIDEMEIGRTHWMVRRYSGSGSMMACSGAHVFTNRSDNRFRAFVHSSRACPRCVELFNEHNR